MVTALAQLWLFMIYHLVFLSCLSGGGGEVCAAHRRQDDELSRWAGEPVRRRVEHVNLSLNTVFVYLTWICDGVNHRASRGILSDPPPPTALNHDNLQWIIPPWEDGLCTRTHTHTLCRYSDYQSPSHRFIFSQQPDPEMRLILCSVM